MLTALLSSATFCFLLRDRDAENTCCWISLKLDGLEEVLLSVETHLKGFSHMHCNTELLWTSPGGAACENTLDPKLITTSLRQTQFLFCLQILTCVLILTKSLTNRKNYNKETCLRGRTKTEVEKQSEIFRHGVKMFQQLSLFSIWSLSKLICEQKNKTARCVEKTGSSRNMILRLYLGINCCYRLEVRTYPQNEKWTIRLMKTLIGT